MLGVAWFRVRPSLFELLFRSCFILGLAFVCLYVGVFLAFVCLCVGVFWLLCICVLVCITKYNYVDRGRVFALI